MQPHPCRWVIGSHVSSFFSYPCQRTLYGVVLTSVSSPTWLWKSSPIAYLFWNPLQWPICVLRKSILGRIKVRSGCTYRVGLFGPGLALNSCLMFLNFCKLHPYQRSCQMRWAWNSSFEHGVRPAVNQVRTSARHCTSPFVYLAITTLFSNGN
jgi:hypothetical protein